MLVQTGSSARLSALTVQVGPSPFARRLLSLRFDGHMNEPGGARVIGGTSDGVLCVMHFLSIVVSAVCHLPS